MTLATFLEHLTPAEPVQAGAGLTVLPLLHPEPSDGRDYDLLDEALANGRVAVDESGEVPTLRMTVRGQRPVLVPQGTILEGGLQTRTVNITLMLPEGEHLIPVSCVERGRWGRSRPFTLSPHIPDALLRSIKAASTTRRLREGRLPRADQETVWYHIARVHESAYVDSPTEDLTEAFRVHNETLQRDIAAVPTLPHQVGAVFLLRGKAVGLDVFDHPATWAAMAPKVLKGYAATARWSLLEDAPSMDWKAFLEAVSQTPTEGVDAPVGRGRHILLEGNKVSGFALEEGGRIRHLFAAPARL